MDEFIEEEEILSKSIKKSKDAYRRIKMNSTVEKVDVVIKTKYRAPVERIQEVLRVLDGVERAKHVLSTQVKEKSLEERFEEYNTFKILKEELRDYEKTDTIRVILEKIKVHMKENETFLDEIAKKRLFLLLEGVSHENWAEFLVNKPEKKHLFISLVKKYAESMVKHRLEDRSIDIDDLLTEIEIFAKTGFDRKQAEDSIEELHSFIGSIIINAIGKKCYVFIKGVDSPIKRLRELLEFTSGILVENTFGIFKRLKIKKKVQDILKSAYRPIYKEAEEQFITGRVHEKRLLDSDLFHILQEMDGVDKLRSFLGKNSRRDKKMEEFYTYSKQKAKTAGSKLEGMIFLLNSVHLINMVFGKGLPEKELLDEIVEEIRRKLNKAVENPEKKNKIGEIIRYVEKVAVKAKHYTVPLESREYLIGEYKNSVREIAKKYGGLDDVTDSHLSETIEGFYNGPIRKIRKAEEEVNTLLEKGENKETEEELSKDPVDSLNKK